MMLKIWLLLSVCDGLEICPSVERVELALAFGSTVRVTCDYLLQI